MILLSAARVILLALFGLTSVRSHHGLATRFGDPGDRLTGRELFCTQQPLRPGQLACAHRTLPCGTTLILENPRNGRFAVCQVMDRGPFGAILPTGEWATKIHPGEPGDWRGILDLAPAVSEALGHNGFEPIRVFYQRAVRHLRDGHSTLFAFASR